MVNLTNLVHCPGSHTSLTESQRQSPAHCRPLPPCRLRLSRFVPLGAVQPSTASSAPLHPTALFQLLQEPLAATVSSVQTQRTDFVEVLVLCVCVCKNVNPRPFSTTHLCLPPLTWVQQGQILLRLIQPPQRVAGAPEGSGGIFYPVRLEPLCRHSWWGKQNMSSGHLLFRVSVLQHRTKPVEGKQLQQREVWD